MKRLSAFLCFLFLACAAWGINVTNYPLRTTAQSTDWFWLSSVPDKTNYNFPYSSLLSQMQTDLTFPLSGIQTNLGSGTNNTLVNVTIIGGTLSNVSGNFAASRLQGYVAVTDLPGVVGDGATDCTAGLNTGLALGTNLYWPPGTYLTHALSTGVPQRMTFAPGATVKFHTNDTGYLLALNGQGNTVEGPGILNGTGGTNVFFIDGTNYGYQGAYYPGGVILAPTNYDDYYSGFVGTLPPIGPRHGIYVNPIGNSRISDLSFINFSGAGLTVQSTDTGVDSQVNHYFVRSCYFTNCGCAMRFGDGTTANAAEYGIVIGNKGFHNSYFIDTKCANIEFVGNSCNYAEVGFYLNAYLSGGVGRSHDNLVGSTFNHCGFGYYITGASSGVNINGNNFLGCVGATITGNSDAVMIHNNYFQTAPSAIIDYSVGTNYFINNLITMDTTWDGNLVFDGWTNAVMYGNYMAGNNKGATTNNGILYPGKNTSSPPVSTNGIYAWLPHRFNGTNYWYPLYPTNGPVADLLTAANHWTGASNTFDGPVTFRDGIIVESTNSTSTLSNLIVQGTETVGGTLSATNGLVLQMKPSFTTNFTCTTNLQFYCLNGNGQIITLPNAANVPGVVYTFSTTNKLAIPFIVTNSTGTQTIADGASLSYTNNDNGIKVASFISDGSAWWLTKKSRTTLPSASWSCSTNITFGSVTNMVTLDTTEANNGVGITLDNSAWATAGVGSKIWVTNAGMYMLTFSAVWSKVGGGAANGDVWIRQDGVTIPRTMTLGTIQNSTSTNVMTVNFILPVTKTTYFDLVGASPDGLAQMQAMPAITSPFARPACPSIIVTINKCSD